MVSVTDDILSSRLKHIVNFHTDLISMDSQLPDFLGGTCSCMNEGGCLRSDKGPWNDPELMKVGLVFPH